MAMSASHRSSRRTLAIRPPAEHVIAAAQPERGHCMAWHLYYKMLSLLCDLPAL